ncbi:NAD(P)-dependent oxidoreductase [Aestuariibacter sp. GS-14]|uniref:NAD(P)-dependent oxidoreductase n=1 Tax=Aestuariibacter sp. GS-14 TaxID=2590670 RepID=UPI001126D513|nr:NAD(P)-dependent oxidoreductase [Aestuariibacter sp. GS-14]TPV59974.1 NAD(P)-dependent oxidoreductase [Aestuariibacter sp. GS-14]
MTNTNNSLRIGFIGLGKMGAGICANIQDAGYQLTVYNRTHEKTAPFVARGATAVYSITEVLDSSDIIFSSLLDDKSLLDLCLQNNGIAQHKAAGKIHVGLTTVLPDTSSKLAEAHQRVSCHYIAAPVVGRPDAAAAGALISFIAGDKSATEIITPVVNTYTKKQVYLGPHTSSANALKICTNYMAMTQLNMLGEIFTYGEKSGLNRDLVAHVASLFFAGNEPMLEYVDRINNRDFDTVGFNLSAGLKDALIFDQAFTDAGLYAGAIAKAKENLLTANARGLGNKDWSALTEMTRQSSGL